MALLDADNPFPEAEDDERPAPRRFLGGYRRSEVDDLLRVMQAEIDLQRDRLAALERRLADRTLRAAADGTGDDRRGGGPGDAAGRAGSTGAADAGAADAGAAGNAPSGALAADAALARAAAGEDLATVLASARKFAARIVTEAEREADLKRRAVAADRSRLQDEQARLELMIARFDKVMTDTRAALHRRAQ